MTGVEPRAEDGEKVRQSEASEDKAGARTEGGHATEDKSETTKKGDKKDDITSIMVEIQALKTAILAIEQGMMKLSSRVDEIEKNCRKNVTEQHDHRSQLQETVDGKVATYQEVVEETTKKEIHKMNNRIDGLKEMADTFKVHIQTQLDNFVLNTNKDEEIPSGKEDGGQFREPGATEAEVKELKRDINNLFGALESQELLL